MSVEPGVIKADFDNLPEVNVFMIMDCFNRNKDFDSTEMKGIKLKCMSGSRSTVRSNISILRRGTCLGDLLATRPSGLVEAETWAILCQSVQALQDLFLSDGLSGKQCIPLVTPSTLMLSPKGRVKLCLSNSFLLSGPPAHLASYLAPEYKVHKTYSDTEFEKMWIFSLGETLNRASFTSHVVTSGLSRDLCQVLTNMTRVQTKARASLMHLLDVMSEYCKKRQQNRPFSHIVMDLHQEAVAGLEEFVDTPWGPPAMPEIVPRHKPRSESIPEPFGTIPRRWQLSKHHDLDIPKITKEVATSMEDLSMITFSNKPGKVVRPRSLCVPENRCYQFDDNNFFNDITPGFTNFGFQNNHNFGIVNEETSDTKEFEQRPNFQTNRRSERLRVRRNPVQRAASRLYRAGIDLPTARAGLPNTCVGPEFVVRAALPTKKLVMAGSKGTRKVVTVIMLDGQKLNVTCSPSKTTAGQLLELIIQKEQIEENFLLGLSALIAGDFVFLPSDTRICKVMQSDSNSKVNLTLFLRVRFFLPSLRGIRGSQARHSLYLQLRRSILEHQLPCSFSQIIELNGLALQAEFGNYIEIEHEGRDYFLLEHYVPETMTCVMQDQKRLRKELTMAHISKQGLEREKAEQDFIIFTQNLTHYGGHFYTAIWMLKDNTHKDIWLYISAQGINLYERGRSTSHFGPQLYEMFEWKTIQTLCYSKHYLCILPHSGVRHRSKLKKYKLKMDYKKSYFAFRLASLHHQFFLRLRTEYTSLQTLSQQFGIPIKDIKNETNSLCKLDAFIQPIYAQLHEYDGTVNADTEFKVEFKSSKTPNQKLENNYTRRSKSVQCLNTTFDEVINEDFQNRENENPVQKYEHGLVLDSSYFAGLPNSSNEKRRGVKMGTRAFSNLVPRVSRSMETVNASVHDYLEQMSLESVSLHCSSTSISKSSVDGLQPCGGEAYVLDTTIQSVSQQNFLPNFQETINETLLEKLNNMSFAEERLLSTVTIKRDDRGSFGLQITEGSDGHVYVQSVIPGGPAQLSRGIVSGDQVVAVNGHSLLGRKYIDSLELLKSTGRQVEFVLSRVVTTFRTENNRPSSEKTLASIVEEGPKARSNITMSRLYDQSKINCISETTISEQSENSATILCKLIDSPVEKHLTESCHDLSNIAKYINRLPVTDVSYNRSPVKGVSYNRSPVKDISYQKSIDSLEREQEENNLHPKNVPRVGDNFSTNISSSLSRLPNDNDRAVIVDMIPKKGIDWWNFPFDHTEAKSKRTLDRDKRLMLDENKFLDQGNIKDNTYYIKNDNVALPRSLGLSRKWKGPVRYPVTPVKKTGSSNDDEMAATSDDEQVFI